MKPHYMLVLTHRMYNSKSEPQSKLRTLGDYDVTVGSSIKTNVPHWCGEGVENGGRCACVGAGGVWEISVPSS